MKLSVRAFVLSSTLLLAVSPALALDLSIGTTVSPTLLSDEPSSAKSRYKEVMNIAKDDVADYKMTGVQTPFLIQLTSRIAVKYGMTQEEVLQELAK